MGDVGHSVVVEIGLITSSKFFHKSSVLTAWFIFRKAKGLRVLTPASGVPTSGDSSVVESFDVSRSSLTLFWSLGC